MAEGPAEGVAGAEAVDCLHGNGGGDHAFGAGLRHHTFGAKLDDGDLDAGRQEAVRLLVRVPSPTATAHSLSLPIATVTWGRIRATWARASSSESQNMGR